MSIAALVHELTNSMLSLWICVKGRVAQPRSRRPWHGLWGMVHRRIIERYEINDENPEREPASAEMTHLNHFLLITYLIFRWISHLLWESEIQLMDRLICFIERPSHFQSRCGSLRLRGVPSSHDISHLFDGIVGSFQFWACAELVFHHMKTRNSNFELLAFSGISSYCFYVFQSGNGQIIPSILLPSPFRFPAKFLPGEEE